MKRSIRLLAAVVTVAAALVVPAAEAATPGRGTVGPTAPTVAWEGPTRSGLGVGLAPVGDQAETDVACAAPGAFCDDFTLRVGVPPTYWASRSGGVTIAIQWASTANDFDLFVYDGSGTEVGRSSGSASKAEKIDLDKPSGEYLVRTVYADVTSAGYRGTATFSASEPINLEPPPVPAAPNAPRFDVHTAPPGMGDGAGEPTLGVNYRTGKVMYIAGLQTLRVSFDDCSSPAKAVWEDKSTTQTSVTSLDPLLFTDSHLTGNTPNRCFVSQLAGKTSLLAFTDNDGETYTPSQGSGINSGVDHQSIGGGPYRAGFGLPAPGQPYPRAVYYCSQDIADASCARSDNGGVTFGPAVPIYSLAQCGGLHGHVKVAPDGTVYVPNKNCGGGQTVVVSEDNGLTWSVRPSPAGSVVGETDPSVEIARDGTVYLGYLNGAGRPRVAVSKDRGRTWINDQDVAAGIGIQSSVFPAITAGDGDRASMAYIATTTPGNPEAFGKFKGLWHLYVSTTFDGGKTWTTVNATPGDPVQRGSICLSGTACTNSPSDRNLLDFIDATTDAQGRILVSIADGCIDQCIVSEPNSFAQKAVIVRQSGGRRLLAEFDPAEPRPPSAPSVSGTVAPDGTVTLSWVPPDDGGSPITGYAVYRKLAGEDEFQLLGRTRSTKFVDEDATPAQDATYRVTATNRLGESTACEIATSALAKLESRCESGGITVVSDARGDALNEDPGFDVERIGVGEPYFEDGKQRLVFTIKVASLERVPPNATWTLYFTGPDDKAYYVAMRSQPTGVTFERGNAAKGSATGAAYSGAVKVADAEAGSAFSRDGTIRIIVPTPAFGITENGQALTRFLARITLNAGPSGIVPDNAPDTVDAPQGAYTVAGNESCRPNLAPVAKLVVEPREGNAPLRSTLDASGSVDDDGDGIVEYAFDFGDGEKVRQRSPKITHLYRSPGGYRATVRVLDGRGARSLNIDFQKVVVGGNATGGKNQLPATGTSGRGPLVTLAVAGSFVALAAAFAFGRRSVHQA